MSVTNTSATGNAAANNAMRQGAQTSQPADAKMGGMTFVANANAKTPPAQKPLLVLTSPQLRMKKLLFGVNKGQQLAQNPATRPPPPPPPRTNMPAAQPLTRGQDRPPLRLAPRNNMPAAQPLTRGHVRPLPPIPNTPAAQQHPATAQGGGAADNRRSDDSVIPADRDWAAPPPPSDEVLDRFVGDILPNDGTVSQEARNQQAAANAALLRPSPLDDIAPILPLDVIEEMRAADDAERHQYKEANDEIDRLKGSVAFKLFNLFGLRGQEISLNKTLDHLANPRDGIGGSDGKAKGFFSMFKEIRALAIPKGSEVNN